LSSGAGAPGAHQRIAMAIHTTRIEQTMATDRIRAWVA
jgi:hypothetical protein